MHPVLFQIGPVTIYSYGVLVATGVLVGLWLARRQARDVGLDPDKAWNLGIYMVLSALVVAKLWMVVADWAYFRVHWREIFTLSTLQSGGVFYGGVIGALAVAVLYSWRAHLRFLPLSDAYAAPLALGHAIGRLGCFAAGCCYGKPTSMFWGVTFTNPVANWLVGTPLGVPLHPTELYESAAEFFNFLFLLWLGRRRRIPGQLFGAYILLYGLERGTIEFFRGDPGRTMLYRNTFSLMQIVSLGLILAGTWLWWRGKAQTELEPALKPARR